MKASNILGVIAAIAIIIFLLKDASCWTEPDRVSVVDSLAQIHAEELMAKDVQLTALQWEIRDLNMARKWDSVMIWKQDKALKGSNQKLREVIDAYEADKSLENCDTVIVYANDLSGKVDSLQALLPHYQQTIDELVTVYDEALNAANDKALQQSKFYEQMRQAAKDCEDDRAKVITKLNNRNKRNRTKIIIAAAAGVAAGILISK